jgi:signal transduction histidine kinase/CheY-like chemotaxis protein
MYFLDGTGFFSLICLLIQCILAWIFAAFFVVLSPGQSPWLARWRMAFLGLGVALTAIAMRFSWAHYHIVGDHLVDDGDAMARVAYGVYLAGKVTFVWFLLSGIALLRQRAWPAGRWLPMASILLGAAIGASVPTVEWVLLLQAPWVAAGFACAFHYLRPRPGEPREIGRRVVRVVLGLWSLVWVGYAITVVEVGVGAPDTQSPWHVVLRLNSLIDLSLQVPLAAGLIIVVMHDAKQATLRALLERDRLREEVARAEKMRSLSTLVGGVAHEINNPLTAILGFVEDLGDEDPGVRERAARVVREQAERCSLIVKRMSALGRQQPFACRPVEVEALVRRVAGGLERQARAAGITFEVEPCPGSHTILADGAAIEQVLTNLLANALQATKRGGRVQLHTRCDAERVLFAVDDDGPGVPAADRDRIFEPFWTSKQAADGTGIGLAVAEIVVQAHQSRIEVTESPLGGARFAFSLPLHAGVARAPAESPPRPEESQAVDLDVLVVDDEPQVRSAIRRHLQAQGWRVVEAACGKQGLELLLRGPVRFDVVVCDLRMPGFSGMQLHDAVREQAPDLLRRFVFLTGDLASIEVNEFRARCASPVVGKPFVAAELVGRLREVGRSARSA